MTLKIERYKEQPERDLIEGEAVQLINSNDVAFEIAKWLNEEGIVCWVTPRSNRPSFAPDSNRTDAFPEDWIILQTWSTGRKKAYIISEREMNAYFKKQPTIPATEGEN
jgi:hypothetical protein